MSENNKIRIDQYLWAIRKFKTRTIAKNAIDEGKVRLNNEPVKPSHNVLIGEQYTIRNDGKRETIQVAQLISKRVAYPEAILCYYDVSTEEDIAFNENRLSSSFYTGKRLSKVGRPTKKQSRDIKGFLDNDAI